MGYFVIIGIILALVYYTSLRTYPYTKCKVCNGEPKHFSTLNPDAFRFCRKCGGTGRQERFGARFVRRDRS